MDDSRAKDKKIIDGATMKKVLNPSTLKGSSPDPEPVINQAYERLKQKKQDTKEN